MNDRMAISEHRENPQKVLFIPPWYGIAETLTLEHIFSRTRDLAHEQQIVKIFKENGYIVINGGEYSGAPGQMGITSDKTLESNLETTRYLNTHLNIDSPKELTFQDKPQKYPIVMKRTTAHGGDDIYLIENYDQWIKFQAWFRLNQNIMQLYDQPDRGKSIIEEAKRHVQEGELDWEKFLFRSQETWVAQEYINTPSDYHTSFRVLVDAFGEVYYGKLLRSACKKGLETLTLSDKSSSDPIEAATQINYALNNLLRHPQSPFYLGAKKIVSNVLEGGKAILLNGNNVTDLEDIKMLRAHGIDPQNPQVPAKILESAKRIGTACRGLYPYIGIDFIMDGNLNPYLLEVNSGPMMEPIDFGIQIPLWLKEKYSDKPIPDRELYNFCEEELMKRIAGKPVF